MIFYIAVIICFSMPLISAFILIIFQKQLKQLKLLYELSVVQQRKLGEFLHKKEAVSCKPANRTARTPEQKAAASERKKEWWAKKRAVDRPIGAPSVFEEN